MIPVLSESEWHEQRATFLAKLAELYVLTRFCYPILTSLHLTITIIIYNREKKKQIIVDHHGHKYKFDLPSVKASQVGSTTTNFYSFAQRQRSVLHELESLAPPKPKSSQQPSQKSSSKDILEMVGNLEKQYLTPSTDPEREDAIATNIISYLRREHPSIDSLDLTIKRAHTDPRVLQRLTKIKHELEKQLHTTSHMLKSIESQIEVIAHENPVLKQYRTCLTDIVHSNATVTHPESEERIQLREAFEKLNRGTLLVDAKMKKSVRFSGGRNLSGNGNGNVDSDDLNDDGWEDAMARLNCLPTVSKAASPPPVATQEPLKQQQQQLQKQQPPVPSKSPPPPAVPAKSKEVTEIKIRKKIRRKTRTQTVTPPPPPVAKKEEEEEEEEEKTPLVEEIEVPATSNNNNNNTNNNVMNTPRIELKSIDIDSHNSFDEITDDDFLKQLLSKSNSS